MATPDGKKPKEEQQQQQMRVVVWWCAALSEYLGLQHVYYNSKSNNYNRSDNQKNHGAMMETVHVPFGRHASENCCHNIVYDKERRTPGVGKYLGTLQWLSPHPE